MQKMSEKEAIEWLKAISVTQKESIHKGSLLNRKEALHMAVQALEEIQQYRAIGAVKEIKIREASAARLSKGYLEDLGKLREYQSIGTVEECREAVERMKPKKVKKIQIPNTSWSKACTRFECPSCNKYLNYMELSHCGLCGQEIDWSE